MKTVLLSLREVRTLFSVLALSLITQLSIAQSALIFKNPSRKSGDDLKKGAVYLFEDVAPGVNATVTIDDLVNGAKVKKIDDNSGGLGYINAFQPEIETGGRGESYAQFTIRFIKSTDGSAVVMKTVSATALDIDGNANVKEFGEINMNGGTASYMGTTLEILLKNLPIVNSILNKYRADNILGREKDGIDTSAKGNMFTVTKSDVSSFTVKYGATSSNSSTTSRQFSAYMMGFQYPNQITLPLKLISFAAIVTNNNVDLKWTTDAEKNVSHFTLEKGNDGKNFSDAATIFAYGNTTKEMSYSFKDKLAETKYQVIYYRLRCVDEDGKYTYSAIRIIKLGSSVDEVKIQTYPNPFTSELRVTLPGSMQGKELKMELYNGNGQLVKSKRAAVASQTESFSTSDVERGLYVLQITAGTGRAQQKVVKH